jgi:hypothetical protein
VRIDWWPAQDLIDAFEHALRDDVFQFLGLLVDLGPVQAKHLHEEHLNESVPAQHVQRQLLATPRQPDPGTRLVIHEPGICECFNHNRRRARDHAHEGCQPAHGNQAAGMRLLLQVDLLEVILDGGAWHA